MFRSTSMKTKSKKTKLNPKQNNLKKTQIIITNVV